jgi:hypothetical protein
LGAFGGKNLDHEPSKPAKAAKFLPFPQADLAAGPLFRANPFAFFAVFRAVRAPNTGPKIRHGSFCLGGNFTISQLLPANKMTSDE